MLIDDLGCLPDEWKQGVRAILFLYRNKNGTTDYGDQLAERRVSSNSFQWETAVWGFRAMQRICPNHRIYASVNARDLAKGIHEFKRRQLDIDYAHNASTEEFYMNIGNRFFSAICNPGVQASSYFLIDCDSVEEYAAARATLAEELVLLDYETTNGRHIITKPFNPQGFPVTIHKDGLLYIG